jgi:hypothetical protein
MNIGIEQASLDQVRLLTPEQQQKVLDFAAFLCQKAPANSIKERSPELHKADGYWMTDDFDDPLLGEYWSGES